MKRVFLYFVGWQTKLFVTAFLIATIVSGAIIIHTDKRGQGTLYCTDLGIQCANKVDFIEQEPSDGSNPCGRIAGVPNPVYKQTACDCIAATGPYQQAQQ